MRLLPLFLCAAALALAPPAHAQIVDVQGRFAGEPAPGLSGAAESSVDWRTGSNDYLALRAAFTIKWLRERHLWLTLVQGELGVSGGERTLGRMLEHLRYRYAWTDRLSTEVFLQHELNPFRRLLLRGLVGAGPRLKVVRGEQFTAALGLALMVEHERLRNDEFRDAGEIRTDLRISTYALARIQILERMILSETIYVQPRVNRPADFRILNETSLTVTATERIGLTLSFLLYLDREPPLGVSPLDTQLRSGISVAF